MCIILTEGPFKARYNNHKNTFNNPAKHQSTKLSEHIWQPKYSKTKYTILLVYHYMENIGKEGPTEAAHTTATYVYGKGCAKLTEMLLTCCTIPIRECHYITN